VLGHAVNRTVIACLQWELLTDVPENSDDVDDDCWQYNSIYIGLCVSHRKHITSPLRAQQVNATYRIVKIVY
jgi:hypothetical protein